MASKALSHKALRATAAIYNKTEGDSQRGADAAGIPRGTYVGRVAMVKQRYPKLLKEFAVKRGGQQPQEHGTVTDVRLHRAEQAPVNQRPGYKDALAQLAIVEDRLRDLEWANNVSFKPADWTFKSPRKPQARAYPGAVHQRPAGGRSHPRARRRPATATARPSMWNVTAA
jgi:hypothetical protein